MEDYFHHQKISRQVVLVATAANDPPGLIYLAPYTAMTVAEYFRDQGRNVTVVLDDLSTHSKFYREISLTSGRFPGRESYPGDIFYSHAKIMERAGNFIHKTQGQSSISCFPIVETVEGNLSGYIVTNLMGMTDGHIFFDNNIFQKGRRPAVNSSLSVTRVGKQTQSALKREINKLLTSFIYTYEKVQNYSHFGAELTEDIKNTLHRGDQFFSFFDQSVYTSIPESVQIIIFALIWSTATQSLTNSQIKKLSLVLSDQFKQSPQQFATLIKVDSVKKLLFNVHRRQSELLQYAH